jgi:hypothetical protein
MSTAKDSRPEPNFTRLVSEADLDSIEISAHALQRFVDRLQPGIPGAARAARVMGRLEEIPLQRRSQRERNQLREHRDWLRAHVEPCVRDLLVCEGFWATERPRWSQSRTPSDAHVQIGGLCYWPAALHATRARPCQSTRLARAHPPGLAITPRALRATARAAHRTSRGEGPGQAEERTGDRGPSSRQGHLRRSVGKRQANLQRTTHLASRPFLTRQSRP